MSEDDSEHGTRLPTPAPHATSPRVRFSSPRFDSTSSSSFSSFTRTWLAYIRVTEPQLDMLLLCVDDRARQYYYEVDRPEDSMNNTLEFLRARFEGERNTLAEHVSLAKTVQQPGQSLGSPWAVPSGIRILYPEERSSLCLSCWLYRPSHERCFCCWSEQ